MINFKLFPENTGDKRKPKPRFSLPEKEKEESFNEFKETLIQTMKR